MQFVEHGGEIGAGLIGLDAAQHVVAAQFEQHEIGLGILRVERECQPLPPRGAGVARDTGIDHPGIDPALAQRILELFGIAFFLFQPVAREQTIAKGKDAPFGPCDRDICDRRGFARRAFGRHGVVLRTAAGGQYENRCGDRQMAQTHRRDSLCKLRLHAIAAM